VTEQYTKVKNIELLYKAPQGHKDPFIWVPLHELSEVGIPFDSEADEELAYLDKIRILQENGSYLYLEHSFPKLEEQFDALAPEDMEKCEICKIDFPLLLINQSVSSEGSYKSCPVCALKNRNSLHRLPMSTPFHGPQAAAMYEMAVKFLKHINRWDARAGLPEPKE